MRFFDVVDLKFFSTEHYGRLQYRIFTVLLKLKVGELVEHEIVHIAKMRMLSTERISQ